MEVLQQASVALRSPTEIRAEEKSRGGMSYEVILSEAISDRPASPPSSTSSSAATSPTSPTLHREFLTHQLIDEKLEQAEQRRKNIEAERVANINERLSRLEEAAKKRCEMNEEFIAATMYQLENKLDKNDSNRELYIEAIKNKVTKHLKGVEDVRTTMENQTIKLRQDIYQKLSSAQENRDDHFRTIMEKLQAHEANVQRVRESHELAMQELNERIKLKLEAASENREAEMERKISALRQHERRAQNVRANKGRMTVSCDATTISG